MSSFDTVALPRLDFPSPSAFWHEIRRLQAFSQTQDSAVAPVREHGHRLLEAFEQVDGFIQHDTRSVCPYCGIVCGANRHGLPQFAYAYVVGFLAMGLDVPAHDLEVDERTVCQFLGPKGCEPLRPQRPFRCTRYFCDPLLEQIEIGPLQHSRRFTSDLQALSSVHAERRKGFSSLRQDLGGHQCP